MLPFSCPRSWSVATACWAAAYGSLMGYSSVSRTRAADELSHSLGFVVTALPNLDSTCATLVQLTYLVGLRVQTHVPTLSGSRLSSGIKLDEPSILYPFVRRPESVYALPCWTANDVARTWFLSISRLSRGSARALL